MRNQRFHNVINQRRARASRALDLHSNAVVEAAWLSLLRTAYTGALFRARRSGDNAEIDVFPLASGEPDWTALLAWVVAGGGTQNGFITGFYGQIGGTLFLTQSNPSLQAQFAQSGALITEGGTVIAQFGADAEYTRTSVGLGTVHSIYTKSRFTSPFSRGIISVPQTATWPLAWNGANIMGFRRETPSLVYLQTGFVNTAYNVKAFIRAGQDVLFYVNNNLQFNSVGNVTETNNVQWTGWNRKIFGNATGTNQERGILVYSTNHDAATVAAIQALLP